MKWFPHWPSKTNQSLSIQILKSIFNFYFLVAIVITISQILLEYRNTRNKILVELSSLEKSFEESIAKSIYREEEDTYAQIAKGVLSNRFVVGVHFTDPEEKKIVQIGVKGKTSDDLSKTDDGIIVHKFKLQTEQGEFDSEFIGYAYFFSHTNLIVNDIKYGVVLIFLNGVIKTLILWFIMIFFISKFLEKPLQIFNKAIDRMDTNELKPVTLKFKNENELSSLKDSFNKLIKNLSVTRNEYKNIVKELEQKNIDLVYYKKHLEDSVTERTKDLIEARNEAQRAHKLKSRFIANISHELRTPLNHILGFTELIKTGNYNHSLNKDFSESIRSSGQYLLNLINDILDLSKIESGKININPGPGSLDDILNQAYQIFKQKSDKKSLKYIIEKDPLMPNTFVFDSTKIRQVLFNIIGNAIKFTDKGFIKIFVSYKIKDKDKGQCDLYFSIEDSGIGIPKKYQEDIFIPFTQLDRNNLTGEGTGLGLSISKQLIEKMGGKIWIEENYPKGSTFKFIIPNVFISDENLIPKKLSVEKNILLPFSKVLIIDDNTINRDLLKKFLNEYKELTISETGHFESILKNYSEKTFDLIFLDLKNTSYNKIVKTSDKIRHSFKEAKIIGICSIDFKENEHQNFYKYFDNILKKPLLRKNIKSLFSQMVKSANHDEEKNEDADDFLFYPPKLKNSNYLIEDLINIEETFNSIYEVPTINDVENFAKTLMIIGSKYGEKHIIKMCKKLLNNCETFDINALEENLKIYKEYFDKLKSLDENE
jgi:two-component system sensor histidine kinase EvgS